MMLLIMRTFSTDEFNNASYDYAVLKMEEYEAIKIHQHMNLFKFLRESQGDLVEMSFKAEEVVCEFYPCTIFDGEEGNGDTTPKGVQEQLDNIGYAIFEDTYFPPFTPRDAHAPEAVFMKLCSEGFYWEALPNDSMIKINTQVLPPDLLAKVV